MARLPAAASRQGAWSIQFTPVLFLSLFASLPSVHLLFSESNTAALHWLPALWGLSVSQLISVLTATGGDWGEKSPWAREPPVRALEMGGEAYK